MLYVEYARLVQRYHEKQLKFQRILEEKEKIFQKTQPKSMTYDKEKVIGGEYKNKADTYVIELEKLGNELDRKSVV